MESQITSTLNDKQDEVLSSDMDQSTDSPTFVIRDVFSLNAVGQSTVDDDELNSLTVGPAEQLPLHAEASISQNCDTCSDTEDEFFECRVCGEGFSEMNNLLTHTLEHNEQSNECVALKESSKENIEVFNNASPYPDSYVGENVDFEVVDLTDGGNTGGHTRIIFRDLANNDIDQSMIVSTQGKSGDLFENRASNMNCSTDTFSTKPEGKSIWGTGIVDHLMRKENDLKSTNTHNEGQLLRPVSGSSFLDVIDLTDEQEHPNKAILRETGDGSLVMPQSENGFMTVGNLTRLDIEVQGEGPPYVCSVCSKAFKEKCAIYRHMAVHSEDRPHECGVCGKRFKQKSTMRIHMAVHSEERPHKCVCGRGFKRKAHMILHKAVHSKRPYECNVCGKGFELKHSMTLHMAVHNDVLLTMEAKEKSLITLEPLTCSVYGKVSKTQQDGTQHIAVHSKENPFACSICGKVFKSPHGVSQHMAVHSKDKPYTCTECGKRFKFCHYMDAHMALHTGETPYECKICGKGFTANVYLQNHMVVHTDAKPFECVICRKCCKTKNALASHIRSHTVKQPRRSDV